MRRRTLWLVLSLALATGTAFAAEPCGCGVTNRPCQQETLASVALPASVPEMSSAGMEMSLAHCWGCGGGVTHLAAGWIASALLFAFVFGIWRAIVPRPSLLIARLDRLGGLERDAEPLQAPSAASLTPPVERVGLRSRSHSFAAAVRTLTDRLQLFAWRWIPAPSLEVAGARWSPVRAARSPD